MLTGWQARWLARCADRRYENRLAGVLAQRAWRRLSAAAERDEPAAVAAVAAIAQDDIHGSCAEARTLLAERWVATRDPALRKVALETGALGARGWPRIVTAALHGRLQEVPDLPDPSFVSRMCRDHDDAVRDEALRYCATAGGHRLALLWEAAADEVSRYGDDAPLVRALHANPERPRIREAVRAGDLDPMRVLVGADRQARIPHLSGDEINYLAWRLAERADWNELWALVTDVSITHAVELMPLFGDWRPAGDTDRSLFHRLRETRRDLVAAAHALMTITRLQIPHEVPARGITHVSFAPDRDEVVVGAYGRSFDGGLSVFELPGGDLVQHHRHEKFRQVAHLGDAIVAADRDGRLVRYADGRYESSDQWRVSRLTRFAGGFAAICWSVAFGDLREVVVGNNLGDVTRRVSPIVPPLVGVYDIVGDPGSGRFAARSVGSLTVVDTNAHFLDRVLAQVKHHQHSDRLLGFCDPDHLVTQRWPGERPVRWRLSGDTLIREDLEHLGPGYSHDLVALPARGQVAVLESESPADKHGMRVVVRDAETYAEVDAPPALTDRYALILEGSPSPAGRYLAVVAAAGQGAVDVYGLGVGDRIAEFLDRPVADMFPADLATVADLERTSHGRATVEPLGLLRACLERRFRGQAQLGSGAPAGGSARHRAVPGGGLTC